jgi:hypothetical protein
MMTLSRKRAELSVIVLSTLVAGQSTGGFITESGDASKTAYITESAYTFEMTDTYGDGICRRYGASEFKITMNGESGAVSSGVEFRNIIREISDVIGGSTAPLPISGWMSRTMTAHTRHSY